MNRFLTIYISSFLLLVTLAITAVIVIPSPEELILGNWKEISWEYEKIDRSMPNPDSFFESMSQHILEEVVQDLIIHESELWQFLPGGKLLLEGKNGDRHEYQWRLKGWGHILKLIGDDQHKEYYNIAELTTEKLVIYIENDMQVRGLVKITFEKE